MINICHVLVCTQHAQCIGMYFHQSTLYKICVFSFSVAQLLLNRLGAAYQNLPSSQQQQDFVGYLQTSGILRLYPRAATLIANPGDMAAALQKTKMDGRSKVP